MPAVEIVKFFLQTGWVAKVVLVILIIFSLASWSVILGKWRELRAARRASERFLKVFREASRLNEAAAVAPKYRSAPLAGMFQAGYTELEAQIRSTRRHGDAGGNLKLKSLNGIARALERALGAEVERLQRALPMLATTASATPFIGLFGTVWGIMQSFRGIGLKGSANLAVVAPGISEALIATAAGLAAAIPAVVAFNYFTHRISALNAEMDIFTSDFLSTVERQFFRKHMGTRTHL